MQGCLQLERRGGQPIANAENEVPPKDFPLSTLYHVPV